MTQNWPLLILVAAGVYFAARGIVPIYLGLRAKRTGVRSSAKVVSEDSRYYPRGGRAYRAKVKFRAPDGTWVEHVSQYTSKKSRVGQSLDVWYTSGDPPRIWVGGQSAFVLATFISIGLIFLTTGIWFLVRAVPH